VTKREAPRSHFIHTRDARNRPSLGLALGIIDIYGVISYAVSQRTREIGIRLALGARKRELRWMFVSPVLVLSGIGVVIGLGAAAAVARLMRTLLFDISSIDPLSFAVVPLVRALAAALPSFLPASRVAAVNPVDALRVE
jgi:ABC-type antimicrobial peptide transport system permease subunit